jgi:hypothetical protein
MGKLRAMSALGLGRLQSGTDDPVGASNRIITGEEFREGGEVPLRAEEIPADMAAAAGSTPGSMSPGSNLAFQASSACSSYELMMLNRTN